MTRRTFLASSLGGSTIGASVRPPASPVVAGQPRITALAGSSLAALRDRWRRELFEETLPLLQERVIDQDEGGFICDLTPEGGHADLTKDCSFQGRGIWLYSFLYTNIGKNPQYLDIARRTVDLILESMPNDDAGLWPARISRDGRPVAPSGKTIAADVSIAEGLAEFAAAAGEPRYRDIAKRILRRCRRMYDRHDYAPDIVSVYRGPKPFTFPGARSQGAAMVLIGTLSPMLARGGDRELEETLREALDAIIRRHDSPEFALNVELLSHDYSMPANALSQFVYTGHCIETFAIVLQHAVRVRDDHLFQTAAARLRRHLEVARDAVYGGYFRSLNDVSANQWELNKLLWVQEEALNGLLAVIERTGAPWARDLFAETLTHVESKYYMTRWGRRFWISGGDRRVTFEPNLTRVEHYHHPRRLMFGILTLERMLAGGDAEPRA